MGFSENIAKNIKELRETQHTTQEQLANALGISYQAVSKWENGVTIPDALTLPLIAQFFGVSIDELYKSKVNAYKNEAQKWFAKYEESKNQDDFFRADVEFRKLFESNQYSRDDIRIYGLLYEYHMYYCKDMALRQYDKLICEGPKDELYYRVCRQKNLLLARIGRGEEIVSEWEKRIADGTSEIEDYSCLINACFWTKQYDKGITYFEQAVKLLSINTEKNVLYSLYVTGGDLYKELKKYEEAFYWWECALKLNTEFGDALYSIGFCQEELGDYKHAACTWQKVIDYLTQKGFTYELNWPRQLLRNAEEKGN